MSESLSYQPKPGTFQPLMTEQRSQMLSRPSQSYWEDAWRRLKANRRALISLYIVVALLAFTLVGPLLWTIDPSAQDLDQISTPPLADRSATLVEPYRPWDGGSVLPLEPGLRLAEEPTTQAVRLLWDPMAGASAYRVYRNIFPMDPGDALIFGPLMAHRALENRGERVRWSIDVRFCAATDPKATQRPERGYLCYSSADPAQVESYEDWEAKYDYEGEF